MRHILTVLTVCVVTLWLWGLHQNIGAQQTTGGRQETVQAQSEAPVYADVAPIFNQHCTRCHSGSKPPRGLRLDGYTDIMAGGQNGPVVVPGKPQGSELVRRILGTSQPRMPLNGPPWLPDKEIELIENWIATGASEGK